MRRTRRTLMFALLCAALAVAFAAPTSAAPASASPARPKPAPAATDPATAPALGTAQADSLRAVIEDERRDTETFYRSSPQSPLASFARAEFDHAGGWLSIGSAPGNDLVLPDASVLPAHVRVRVQGVGFRVEPLAPGAVFQLGGRDTTAADTAPTWIGVGRYRVRLSYQNAPALIACDPGRAEQKKFEGLSWWPVDFNYRFVLPVEAELRPDTVFVESTHGPPRAAARAGRFSFRVGKKLHRVAAYRLLEPGVGEAAVSVFFRDATSGKGSYGMGRYVDAERLPDGRYVLDFNRATNPYCAVSGYFNCPVPPRENALSIAIPAGEAWQGEEHAK